MKILVFSDIRKWEGYEKLVDEVKPDIIALAGDLTSDGFAAFWQEALYQIPGYIRDLKKRGIGFDEKTRVYRFPKTEPRRSPWEPVEVVQSKWKDSKEFHEIRKRMHTDKFYQFLRHAGKKSHVLIVKGDHDDDFEGDYISEKINKIAGCKEISGKFIEIKGIRFLGLGFNETYYLRIFKPLIEEFRNRVDVVITHCEQSKMPLVSSLKPKIIIRGHFGSGKWLVNDVPSVFTMGIKYTIIELENGKIPKILQYTVGLDNKVKILEKGSCKPWFSKDSEFERYKWLKLYPKI